MDAWTISECRPQVAAWVRVIVQAVRPSPAERFGFGAGADRAAGEAFGCGQVDVPVPDRGHEGPLYLHVTQDRDQAIARALGQAFETTAETKIENRGGTEDRKE
ncbi:hypothetical protein [Microbispora sp. NPDC046933]|uniref:hypothetical protein n=1 Tax=Microbispora sp. NPDC046933 TaxID=3155618 RepID=UPI0033D0DB12